TCEGQNIKYRTCSNVDCPPEAGDFRAQQCSAHADVRYQGQYHEWLPVDNDPDNPCALKCRAQGSGLLVELAPKVLDGTRCYTESLDMCISGACQIVGCDHELGSAAKEDNCGVCNGDGSSCRLVRGHYKSQHASGKTEDTVVVIPYRSRHWQYWSTTTRPTRWSKHSAEVSCDGYKQIMPYDLYHPLPRWESSPWTACSMSCGGGVQSRAVSCVEEDMQGTLTAAEEWNDGYKQIMPYDLYHPLPRWESSPWTACSMSCGGGVQSRAVSCVEEDMQGTLTAAEEWKCLYTPKTAIGGGGALGQPPDYRCADGTLEELKPHASVPSPAATRNNDNKNGGN
ncbi:hypothetical protein CRUP_008103, partial [Coryphaenoides rupestris]